MTQDEIRLKRKELEREGQKLSQKSQRVSEKLRKLQEACKHPNAKEYSFWGGRDEGKKCLDCELDFV